MLEFDVNRIDFHCVVACMFWCEQRQLHNQGSADHDFLEEIIFCDGNSALPPQAYLQLDMKKLAQLSNQVESQQPIWPK